MVSPQIMWIGVALTTCAIAFYLLALQLREARLARGVDEPPSWLSWSASTGGGADHNDPCPRRPLTIHDIISRRETILRWLTALQVPDCEAEDVAQNVIIGAWRNRSTYDPDRCELNSWIYAIVEHHAAIYRRSAYARRVRLFDPLTGPWVQHPTEDTPEGDAAFAEEARRGAAIIGQLAPERAEVLVRNDYEEEVTSRQSRGARYRLSCARADFARELRRQVLRDEHLAATLANGCWRPRPGGRRR
jgi:DNA-directed RNA polymerase specialized sigma24 family protein